MNGSNTYGRWLALALLAGCASGDMNEAPAEDDGQGQQSQAVDPRPVMSEGEVPLVVEMDTVNEVFDLPVRGAAEDAVRGALADAAGRRALTWVRADGTEELLAKSGWHLPPAAAVSRSGARAVCYNRLAEGKRPNPAGGVALLCRIDEGAGWAPEIRVAPDVESAWLQDLVAAGDGFRVRFHAAPRGRLMPAPGEDTTRVAALNGDGFKLID
jgi:hypothetical protein